MQQLPVSLCLWHLLLFQPSHNEIAFLPGTEERDPALQDVPEGQRTELQWGEVLVSGRVGSTLNCVREGFLSPEDASVSPLTVAMLDCAGPQNP